MSSGEKIRENTKFRKNEPTKSESVKNTSNDAVNHPKHHSGKIFDKTDHNKLKPNYHKQNEFHFNSNYSHEHKNDKNEFLERIVNQAYESERARKKENEQIDTELNKPTHIFSESDSEQLSDDLD